MEGTRLDKLVGVGLVLLLDLQKGTVRSRVTLFLVRRIDAVENVLQGFHSLDALFLEIVVHEGGLTDAVSQIRNGLLVLK